MGDGWWWWLVVVVVGVVESKNSVQLGSRALNFAFRKLELNN